jgi:hypothetical protein
VGSGVKEAEHIYDTPLRVEKIEGNASRPPYLLAIICMCVIVIMSLSGKTKSQCLG